MLGLNRYLLTAMDTALSITVVMTNVCTTVGWLTPYVETNTIECPWRALR